MQHAQTDETATADAPEVQLEVGVDDQVRWTERDLNNHNLGCDAGRRCRKPPDDTDSLRTGLTTVRQNRPNR